MLIGGAQWEGVRSYGASAYQVGELDLLSTCAGDAGGETELHGPGAGVHAGMPPACCHLDLLCYVLGIGALLFMLGAAWPCSRRLLVMTELGV